MPPTHESDLTTAAVNEITAASYSDTFAVFSPIGGLVGCEHTRECAKALVKWLKNKHGGGYRMRHNLPDQVRASKQFRAEPVRFQHRDDVFAEMRIGY